MVRYALILAVVALMRESTIRSADAADNPVLRLLVRDAVKKELSARNCKEKGWHQDNTWIWLDNPAANLAVDITNLTLDNGRVSLDGRAAALIDFDHRVAFPIGSKTFAGQARVYISLKASTLAGEQLTNSKVSIGRLEIHELRLHGDAARPFQGMAEDGINLALRRKKRDIEKRLEVALNGLVLYR